MKTASSVPRENLRSELPNTLVDRTVGMSGAHLTAPRVSRLEAPRIRSIGRRIKNAGAARSEHTRLKLRPFNFRFRLPERSKRSRGGDGCRRRD